MHGKQTIQSAGFTLIELIVVLGVIAILVTLVLQAINPAKHFAETHNTKRQSDIQNLSSAIAQYELINHGALPASFSTDAQNPSAIKTTGGVNICNALVPKYIARIPVDPTLNTGITDCTNPSFDSGYVVYQSAADKRVTVVAPRAELSQTISVTR